jgi:hypothetical protein
MKVFLGNYTMLILGSTLVLLSTVGCLGGMGSDRVLVDSGSSPERQILV